MHSHLYTIIFTYQRHEFVVFQIYIMTFDQKIYLSTRLLSVNLCHASHSLKRTAKTFQQFFLIQQICPHSSHPKPSTCQLNSVHPCITGVTKMQPAEFAQRLPHTMVRILQGCIFHLLCFPGENMF